ncbi:MAG: hypothetical protein CVU57_27400 [Deltaproteobacteria bacterium HGW-Deltaproteobacteria-15]|jgi:DNA-binding SARP family transcriptional activator|nr:MAG: hypothetical protein CVU57_27400 [Deltaproteobacteria bacterium HGW-Deltaproteobacteria-15]
MKKRDFLPAKIIRPLLPRVLIRTRLFQLLDKSLEHPVVWVSGPAGSGKTTLLAGYTQAQKFPTLWYKIDSDDADIATFFYYLGLAGQNATPRNKRRLPFLTPEYASGIPAFSKSFFEDLFERLKRPSVLVLDDFHEILSSPVFLKTLIAGLSVMPAGINMIIASRTAPPPEFARFRANRMMAVIDWPQLRLTSIEAHELIAMLHQEDLSSARIERLHKEVDGWVAGLILMLEKSSLTPATLGLNILRNYEIIFDYFAKEVFERLPEEDRDYILTTSVLPRMTASLAESLTGRPESARILKRLYQNNFFMIKHRGQEETYQYHDLFRNFLLLTAKDQLGPAQLAVLKNRAAGLLASHGRIEESVALFEECGAFEKMIPLVLAKAPDFIEQGRHQTLSQWITGLPDDILEDNPWLAYWLGWSRMPYDPFAGRPVFENAVVGFEKQHDQCGALMALSGVLQSIFFSFDTYIFYDDWIPRIEGLESALDGLKSADKAVVISGVLWAMVLRRPDHPRLPEWEQRALDLLLGDLSVELKAQLLAPLLMRWKFSGLLPRAQLMLQEFRRLTLAREVTPLIRLTLGANQVFFFSLHGEFDECRRCCDETLALASATGIHQLDFWVRGHGASGALSCGELAVAQHHLEELKRVLGDVGAWKKDLYYFLSLWKALLDDEPENAKRYADLELSHSMAAGIPPTVAIAHWGRALALQRCGERRLASEEVDRALSLVRRYENHQILFGCLLTVAEFAVDRGDDEAAVEALRQAMALGRQHAYKNVYFWRPQVMADLCGRALAAKIEERYVQQLIRIRSLLPTEAHLTLSNWPWHLKVYTLGRFGLTKDGKPVTFRGKAPQKPLALLKALIAFGGRDVPVTRLLDALWPDLDADGAYDAFTICLHRLRKLVANELAVQVSEEKVTMDQRWCWVDVWAFKHLIGHAEASRKDGRAARACALVEKAIGLYQGDFLAGEREEPWMVAPSERLKILFFKSVSWLGLHLEEAGRWEQAAKYYEDFLELDPCREDFYRRLMVCYDKLDRRSDALSIYQRCRRILFSTLAISPSPETEAVRAAISSQRKA